MPINFAFIDGQNVYLGIQVLGWQIDWKRFRVHLKESYGVTRAYYFIGYLPENQALYRNLQLYGYTLVLTSWRMRGRSGIQKGDATRVPINFEGAPPQDGT